MVATGTFQTAWFEAVRFYTDNSNGTFLGKDVAAGMARILQVTQAQYETAHGAKENA